MLPRLPRTFIQRATGVPSSYHHQLFQHQTSAAAALQLIQIILPSRSLSSSSSFSLFTEDCSKKLRSLPKTYCPPHYLNIYRQKSTKLLQKNRNEPDQESALTPQPSKAEAEAAKKKNLNIINFPASLIKKLKKSDELVPQKTPEEDEKSRRRYEKEDPPEEKRHKDWKEFEDRAINKELMRTDYFDNMSSKSKETFAFALELFTSRDVHLRGHVEFIYSALKQMKLFGIHRDLESYKKIIDVFPKGKMIHQNMFQMEFFHFPKHQQCALDVLEQMEHYGVIPDTEMTELLTNIFGSWSHPMRKAGRMLYWMPKFKNLSPWRHPEEMPDSAMELAKLAVKQITSVDLTTEISIYNSEHLEDAQDLTWIVSGQSSAQRELIEKLPNDRPIYVEGAFRMWMRDICMNYFIIRADAKPPPAKTKAETDPHNVGELSSVLDEDFVAKHIDTVRSVHEQDDGIILAVCCTGSSSRDSIVSWIRFLENSNPRLGKDITVWFTLKSPIGPTDDIEVLSYRDLEELKRLGKPRDPFLAESTLEKVGDSLEIDPAMPDLRQAGVWTESESKFPNWPHHFHKPDSISHKNRLENEKLLEDRERQELEEKEMISPLVSDADDKNKRIE